MDTTEPAFQDRDERPDDVRGIARKQRRAAATRDGTSVRDYLEERWARREVVASTRTPSGQVVDWVPRESQVRDGAVASPPADPPVREALRGEWADRRALFELELPDAEVGPAGTVPLLRKDLSRTRSDLSLEQLLNKYPPGHRRGALGTPTRSRARLGPTWAAATGPSTAWFGGPGA
ncbi:hypothetical protein ET471_16500 [Xylanimonas protaetiae]|uniref:Uncharacterized protein n=1 Tax=Xylanimonas protaetiae TaxID=2509457 RepID=A0A4P6F948_9MICO|nr:hypothetical protein ET471_16500 [Xylanimonas protaetiae]